MAVKQIVTLKGQKDGISIILDGDADFEEIKDSLRKKVSLGKKFFDDADTKVSFKGRELDEFHEKVLIDIIMEETDSDIRFVKESRQGANARASANIPAHAPPPVAAVAAPQKSGLAESNTAYYRGALRSGQRIKFDGSVVVIGDVNPGSEIIANGNVIVLGALKGMAHAGASGDESCFVSALTLRPTQLRIAGTISYVPVTEKKPTASYAYIRDGQVFIGQL